MILCLVELRLLDLEDETKDEASPRGVLEDCSRSLDSETTTSRASTSDWEGHPDSRNPSHWRGFFRLLKKGPQMRFQTFPPLKAVPKLTRRKSKRIREDMIPVVSPVMDSSIETEFCYFRSSWKNFTLSELQAASNNFSQGLFPDTELSLLKWNFIMPFLFMVIVSWCKYI